MQVPDITNVLSAVLFNSSGLTPVSAALNNNTTPPSFSTDTTATNLNVGDGWQYVSGISNNNDGYTSGISSIGLPAFGPSGNFDPAQPQNEVKLDGGGYGIIGTGGFDNTNQGLLNHGPLFENSVVFTLNVTGGFSLSQLGNSVSFQYGTALNENAVTGTQPPPPDPVPEPSTLAIAGLGALGFVTYGLRRRRAR
jgi:hypothetical protein